MNQFAVEPEGPEDVSPYTALVHAAGRPPPSPHESPRLGPATGGPGAPYEIDVASVSSASTLPASHAGNRTINVWGVAVMAFFLTAAGPYGIEVGARGRAAAARARACEERWIPARGWI
jgi:hypothetical protein